MTNPTDPPPSPLTEAPPAPEVTVEPSGPESVRVTVVGDFTAEARRPVIRVVTDLLLGEDPPRAVQLDLHRVTFLNSAGLSTVVQLHRMLEGRGAELELVVGTTIVARPLQLSGLWHRFHVRDERPPGS
ncbi:stage II sporulation protein AA (anti-sigma F factor antagonist) [Klenkia marina]|uniref:Stage II sporulation protein AA (Anti-sigma F factor antagonist) n=1 Tax=Klenkia marina TaxID=1960309 RepID=A0A1G4XZ19_9ACTN|nr:STAS domain-containing protein [Klenkia marina]SCX45878.1 stage II sporulation protein AA (anti-sigma F factor antagonist) [Klenkia marina]